MSTLTKCVECGYPIEVSAAGETADCAYCGQHLEAVVTQGVTISTPWFVGLLGFGLGVLIGPAIIGYTEGGRRWLQKQASGIGR